jgi:hypothetical protein
MYAALWRLLPGPRWLKAVQALVLAVAVVAFCFLWLFPRISPLLPFSQTTVNNEGGALGTTRTLASPFGSPV